MKKNYSWLLFLLLSPLVVSAQPLEQDASFLTGKLENGLTYYIRHNAKEPGIADFYIAQRVGSILEEPRQRGLAHFLEHMAFNDKLPGRRQVAGHRAVVRERGREVRGQSQCLYECRPDGV